MPDTTILVIEDDAAIRRGVVDALEYGSHSSSPPLPRSGFSSSSATTMSSGR
jgi:hypothetical protein